MSSTSANLLILQQVLKFCSFYYHLKSDKNYSCFLSSLPPSLLFVFNAFLFAPPTCLLFQVNSRTIMATSKQNFYLDFEGYCYNYIYKLVQGMRQFITLKSPSQKHLSKISFILLHNIFYIGPDSFRVKSCDGKVKGNLYSIFVFMLSFIYSL